MLQAFVNSISNFQHFETKDEPHSLSISEIIDSEKRGYLNVEGSVLRLPLAVNELTGPKHC